MAKRRANGEGSMRKRKDGRWEGRYAAGTDPVTGKAIVRNVLGKTQAEVKEKLKRQSRKAKNWISSGQACRVGAYPHPRSAAHFRDPRSAKRNRCQDRIQYAGAQQCRIHSCHLHLCHEQGTGAGGSEDGEPAETGTMSPKAENRVDSSPPGAFLKNIPFGSNLGQKNFWHNL